MISEEEQRRNLLIKKKFGWSPITMTFLAVYIGLEITTCLTRTVKDLAVIFTHVKLPDVALC